MPRTRERQQPQPESQLAVLQRLSEWRDRFPDRRSVVAYMQLPEGKHGWFGYIEPEVTFAAPPISEAMAAYYPTLAPYRERQKADLETMVGRFEAQTTLAQKLKDAGGQELAYAYHLAQVQPDDIQDRLRNASAALFENRLLPEKWEYYGAKAFVEKMSAELMKNSKPVDLEAKEQKP